MIRSAYVLVAAIAALVAACTDAPDTEVMLVVDAEPGIRRDATALQVVVEASTGRPDEPWAIRDDLTFPGAGSAWAWPRHIALVPLDGDVRRTYHVTATARDDSGELATVRAMSGYVEHKVLELRLVLEDACRGVACEADQTCGAGGCVSAQVEAGGLPVYGETEPPGVDAGRDAGVTAPDAGRDGATPRDSGPFDGGPPLDSGPFDAGPPRPPPSVFPSWPLPGTPGHPFSHDVRELTVVDRVTGLEWERAVSAPSYTQAEALTYCESLALDGKSDWRLPTRIELLSIVEYGRSGPSIDPTAFPSTPSTLFWTSSAVVGAGDHAWSVDFDLGETYYDGAISHRVRCVR